MSDAAGGAHPPAADAYARWRARVDADLAGRSFDDVLVSKRSGLSIAPLEVAHGTRALLGARRAAPRHAVVRARVPSADELRDERAAGIDTFWFFGVSLPSELDAVLAGTTTILEAPPTPVGPSAARRVVGRDVVDGLSAHERGATAVTEVAVAIATWLASPDTTSIAVAVGPELLVDIAKLRALRSLLARLAAFDGRSVPQVLTRTSFRALSLFDRPTNALRATLGNAAALIGGADVVATAPFDLLVGGAETRLARNTGLVAELESGLAVADDAARGSHAIEALTRDLEAAAWELVREVDRSSDLRSNGLDRAVPRLATWIERDAADRDRELRSRELPMVGVSRYPVRGETATADADVVAALSRAKYRRDAEAFEALRDVGRGITIEVAIIGDAKKLAGRAAFAREVLGLTAATVRETRAAELEALPASNDRRIFVGIAPIAGRLGAYVGPTDVVTVHAPSGATLSTDDVVAWLSALLEVTT